MPSPKVLCGRAFSVSLCSQVLFSCNFASQYFKSQYKHTRNLVQFRGSFIPLWPMKTADAQIRVNLWPTQMVALFAQLKPVIGVIHVGALPGTPRSTQTIAELVTSAKAEARLYREAGVDGVMIENMHDVPYLRGEVGPEIVAAMTAIASEVKSEVKSESPLPVGIQILAGAN